MEIVAASFTVASVTARAGSTVWQLCEIWQDAPRDIFDLRDDLTRAGEFFLAVQHGLQSALKQENAAGWTSSSGKLEGLLLRGQRITLEIQRILDKLCRHGEPLQKRDEGVVTNKLIGGRGKLEWLTKRNRVYGLRQTLRHDIVEITAALMLLNVTISTEMHTMIDGLDKTIANAVDTVALTTQSQIQDGFAQLRVQSTIADEGDDETQFSPGRLRRSSTGLSTTSTLIASPVEVQLEDLHSSFISHMNQQLNKFDSSQALRMADHFQEQNRRLDFVEKIVAGLGHGLNGSSSDGSSPRQLHDATSANDHVASTVSRSVASATTDLRLTPLQACDYKCQCKCHSIKHSFGRWTPLPFSLGAKSVLGSLTISYRGFSRNSASAPFSPCTLSTCRRSRHSSAHHGAASAHQPKWVRLDFVLPPWVMRLAISVFVSLSAPAPELLLRVVRRLSPDSYTLSHSIIGMVETRDLTRLRALISTLPGAVHDRRGDDGGDALSTAVSRVRYYRPSRDAEEPRAQEKAGNCGGGGSPAAIVRQLLAAGADPLSRDDGGGSSADVVLRLYITGSPRFAWLGILFAPYFADVLEENGWTPLHRVVAGLLPLDLAECLRKEEFRKHLNTATGQGPEVRRSHKGSGLTPLLLAAYRGDERQLRLLVEAGADPTARDGGGATAIHLVCLKDEEDEWAGAEAGYYRPPAGRVGEQLGKKHGGGATTTTTDSSPVLSALRYLLSPPLSLDPRARTVEGHTPMHYARTPGQFRLLRDFGADPRALDLCRAEPVAVVAWRDDNPAAVSWLLHEGGADMNHRDWEGDVPVCTAIYAGRVGSARVFLEAGVDLASVNDHGQGTLHWLAMSTSVEMLRLFAASGMMGAVDRGLRDQMGRTAEDLWASRGDPGDELEAAWRELLDSIQGGDKEATVRESRNSDETAYDSDSEADTFFDAI